jgi:hypothetical protein
MLSDFRGKDAFTADMTFKRINKKVQDECFGPDSEDGTRPVRQDVQVFYKHMSQLEWTPDKGGLMKLMADWEANGCHGAMANSGVSPLDWATDHSLAEKQEDDYKKIFTEHVQEIFASRSSSAFFDENANHMPENFLEAVSAVRGPNAWQAAPPCIEGSNVDCFGPDSEKATADVSGQQPQREEQLGQQSTFAKDRQTLNTKRDRVDQNLQELQAHRQRMRQEMVVLDDKAEKLRRAAAPCIEGSNVEEKEQLFDPMAIFRPGTNIPTSNPMQPGAGGPYVRPGSPCLRMDNQNHSNAEEEEGEDPNQWIADMHEMDLEKVQVQWLNMKEPELRAYAIRKGVLNAETMPKKDDLINGLVDWFHKFRAEKMQGHLSNSA